MSSSHGLQIVLWIEVAVTEYDGVGGSQIKALSTALCTQQKHKRVCVVVELTDSQVAFLGPHRPVQTLVRELYRTDNSLSRRFNGHLPGEPGLVGVY